MIFGDDVNSVVIRWCFGGFEWSKIKYDIVIGNMFRNIYLWSYKKKEDILNIILKFVFYLFS